MSLPISRSALLTAVILCLGFLLRLPGLADPPLDFHPTRQYRSAILARGYVLDSLPNLEPAARAAARTEADRQPRIEPPLMEYLAAHVYGVIGREDLAWARALSVLAWSLGGIALYWLGLQLLTAPAASAAVAVWTFLPFAIRASRSFQPDPLMTALIVLALAAAVRFSRTGGVGPATLLTGAGAAALLVKAVALFFLYPGLAAILLLRRADARDKTIAVILMAAMGAPAAVYYARLPLASDYGPFPQLFGDPAFWRGWLEIVIRVGSLPIVAAALPGAALARGAVRRLIVAMFIGYVAFGLVFTHHIYTHDYYSLPLIPALALGTAALIDVVQRRLARTLPQEAIATALAVGCFAAATTSVVRANQPGPRRALTAEAARYERIGRVVGHSTHVLSLDGAYGLPLAYHGLLATVNWPLSIDLAMLPLTAGHAPSPEAGLESSGAAFFVCTVQPELDAQPELAQLLAQRFAVADRDGQPDRWRSVVYDLRRSILSLTPRRLSVFTHVEASSSSPQPVTLWTPPDARWRIEISDPGFIRVEPSAGVGPATLQVVPNRAAAATERTIAVTARAGPALSADLEVHFKSVATPDAPPFGAVDLPPDPVALSRDPVTFQGWALDDVDLRRVWVAYDGPSGVVVPLGDARRAGTRPDVAALYPAAPDLFKAAWSFTLDPGRLAGVSRPLTLRFFAEDGGGRRTEIGVRTVR